MAAAGARVKGTIDEPVPPEVAVTVYRCVADARADAVVVRSTSDSIELEIDGDVSQLGRLAPRVEALGGTLELSSGRAVCRLPLSPRPGT
jgi:hypothetical protein